MRSQGAVLRQIQAVYEGRSVAGFTDAQLVERFANERGEKAAVAFSVLVERHGPMVMRVCRASLRNRHDAEDAFQAVFLVLVRKADTLWVRDSLGPWLHAVAMRTSACAKTQSERRRAHEWRRTQASQETVEVTEDDLVAAIHEEVGRLPDRFREAVVLCDLEGSRTKRRPLGWGGRSGRSKAGRREDAIDFGAGWSSRGLRTDGNRNREGVVSSARRGVGHPYVGRRGIHLQSWASGGGRGGLNVVDCPRTGHYEDHDDELDETEHPVDPRGRRDRDGDNCLDRRDVRGGKAAQRAS